MTVELEVGKVYRDRVGNRYNCTECDKCRIDPQHTYCLHNVMTGLNRWYDKFGYYYSAQSRTDFDIVEEVLDKETEKLIEVVVNNPTNKVNDINETLKERGNAYGTFENNANCTQFLLEVLIDNARKSHRTLERFELEALHMVCHKMSRIVCGQKKKKDNWHDIAGYAKLAEDLTEDM